jgi:hypothetical protein
MKSPASGRNSSPNPEPAVQVGAALAQAPQAGRIEAADHHLALGHQHALDLAQGGVRVGFNSSECGSTTRSRLFSSNGSAPNR